MPTVRKKGTPARRSRRPQAKPASVQTGLVGWAVELTVIIADGRRMRRRTARWSGLRRPTRRPSPATWDKAVLARSAAAAAGLGHPLRLALLARLLEDNCTHAALKAAVRVAPGPMYHHLRELERAGLLVVAARNRYAITMRGRSLFLALMAAGRLGR